MERRRNWEGGEKKGGEGLEYRKKKEYKEVCERKKREVGKGSKKD